MVTNNSANQPTAASGKVLQGQGVGTVSNFSTATYPSLGTGTGKILRADGTNWTPTTATFPDTAGSSGNVLTSDGTNWNSFAPPHGILSVTGTLTNAQIKALHGTPVQVIASPGAGKMISIVVAYGKLNYGGTNVFVAGAGQVIQWYYGTAAASCLLINNANIVAAVNKLQVVHGGASGSPGAASNFESAAINLYNDVATEITGNAANNNTITYFAYYQIISL